MSSHPISDSEHQKKYINAIKMAKDTGFDAFQAWFNHDKDAIHATIRGSWDFAVHILTPKVVENINTPEEKVALEIGYGGGRLLHAACNYFNEVIGIDIHNEQETVATYLHAKGKNNFRLIKTSGRTIDVESESIDFVYTFIVLQHLPSWEVLINYIEEIYRVLKPNGVAQLYFGRYSKLRLADRLRYFFQGYKEMPEAPVNYTSLVIRDLKIKKLLKHTGFTVIDRGSSYKDVPDGYPKIRGGQRYMTVLKNNNYVYLTKG